VSPLPPEPAPGTPLPEPAPGTLSHEPALGTPLPEPAPGTLSHEPALGTPSPEPAPQKLPPEPSRDSSSPSPYRGLASFSASDEDAALFFGRDRDRELVLANLLASRLTLLYGQSGVGKSSLLCAGVVHRLRQSAPSTLAAPRQAVVYVNEWHGDPSATILRELRAEARRLSGHEWEPVAAGVSLADALETWSTRLDAQVLLVLDQFEQYFLYHPAARMPHFDAELAGVVACADLRVRCLISLREDALVGLDRFKDEIPDLFQNRLRLNRLIEQAALETIRRPLDRCNELRAPTQPKVELERGLAEEVVRQLRDDLTPLGRGRGVAQLPAKWPAGEQRRSESEERQPLGEEMRWEGEETRWGGEEMRWEGEETQLDSEERQSPDGEAPPPDAGQIEPAHLQLVMQALWSRELTAGSTRLRLDTLAALGGCAEIVRSYVEAALDGLPLPERRVAARAIRYLVTPSGTKIAHTPTDLAAYVGLAPARIAVTLERMSALRILRGLAPAEGSREGRYEVWHDILTEPILDWAAHFQTERLALRVRWLLGALIAAVTAALVIGGYALDPRPLNDLELRTIDTRFNIRGPAPADHEIAIVELDPRSLRALDGGRYPNPALRIRDAELIERLLAAAPRVIALDITFRRSGPPRDDTPLEEAIKRAGRKVVLAASIFNQEGEVPLFGEPIGPTELLRELGAHVGYSDFLKGPGGVYRLMSYDARGPLLTFAVQTADIAAGHPVPHFGGQALIDYRGPPGSFRTVSMIDVLDGRVPPSVFRGKIVLVGVSAPAGKDLHNGPFSSRTPMPGPEVEANAIATARNGPPITGVGTKLTLALILLLSFAPLAGLPFAWWKALVLYAAAGGAYLLLAQLLFDAGVYLPIVYPLLAFLLAACAMLAARGAYVAWRRLRRKREAGVGPSPTIPAEPAPRTADPVGAS
jgi:CHASE2 domain-containing sensor protein